MIKINNTENLTGVSISGDYNDLDKLVDAFYAITIDEDSEKNKSYIRISNRVLGLCYDVRHAMQGDREVELVDNGIDEFKMKFHSIIAPKSNVSYKCFCLYPEMFFITMALNELVKLRIAELTKSKYVYLDALDAKVVWDEKIATIRSFQAEFMRCVKELLSEASFTRWLKIMNSRYSHIEEIASQYVDLQNIKYIKMYREKRLKSLSAIARRIAEFSSNPEHIEIKEVVVKAAEEYGCCEGDIQLEGIAYPDDIEW